MVAQTQTNKVAFNLVKKVAEFLKQKPNERYTARQIAEWIFATYPDACKAKQQRSTATVVPLVSSAALIQQLVAEIGANRPRLQIRHPQIKTSEGRPRKYYYTDESDETEIAAVEQQENDTVSFIKNNSSPKGEQLLYPKLIGYLVGELNIHSKRIDEKKSSNNKGPKGNKWLYPDIVGIEDLSRDWNREVKDCVKECAGKKAKLWSFEVKQLINRSNVREVFFQTVSNSSWANFGYLVAGEIGGSETMAELQMLAGLHGIGVIRLDKDNPSESQILIPAREHIDIDWNTASRLADENTDFLDYIKQVRQFHQTGEISKFNWDKSLNSGV
ncbi:COG2958 family protein [Bartonella sp. LJL80]